MYSDAVNDVEKFVEFNVIDFAESLTSKSVFEKWKNFPISKISHHGRNCCEIARNWLFAMDYSNLNGASILTGPRWIRQRYNWGPTRWKIHWCEAIDRTSLDCGAQAALAKEVFDRRGVRCFQVQLVQKYSIDATNHWLKRWRSEDTSVFWINEDLIYHEGCAVVINDNEIKIWDASAGWWINPKQFNGYGSLLALRLFALGAPDSFIWGDHLIAANQWQEIKQEQAELVII